jgi:hypothetical protein
MRAVDTNVLVRLATRDDDKLGAFDRDLSKLDGAQKL